MGLTTGQFLEMSIWQFNAYSQAWKARNRDALAIEIQGAWMTAYWSSRVKHKKSLQSVLRGLQESEKDNAPRQKIDKKAAENLFKQFEEIKAYGWTQVERN